MGKHFFRTYKWEVPDPATFDRSKYEQRFQQKVSAMQKADPAYKFTFEWDGAVKFDAADNFHYVTGDVFAE